MPVEHEQGLLDSGIMILRKWIDAHELSAEMAISAITLAELSAGPHQVRGGEQSGSDEHAERARRMDLLQRAENEFDPIPFDVEAARLYGRICAAVVSTGRKPRHRVADLMIATIAAGRGTPPLLHQLRRLQGPRRLDHHRARHPARDPARPVVPRPPWPAPEAGWFRSRSRTPTARHRLTPRERDLDPHGTRKWRPESRCRHVPIQLPDDTDQEVPSHLRLRRT